MERQHAFSSGFLFCRHSWLLFYIESYTLSVVGRMLLTKAQHKDTDNSRNQTLSKPGRITQSPSSQMLVECIHNYILANWIFTTFIIVIFRWLVLRSVLCFVYLSFSNIYDCSFILYKTMLLLVVYILSAFKQKESIIWIIS